VVVSDLRCFDDYIEHGVNGLRFEHRSPHPEQNLATALADLIAATKLVRDISDKGNMVARNFQTSVIAGKMLADFQTLIVK
jgi:glycosyltransferase involved in cell wall biosynthesis